jgi:hypothetical protein
MKFYSQSDTRWGYYKLGTCNTTIKGGGCFIVCYAMLADKTPAEVNTLFKNKGGYASGCLVVQSKCSAILGLEDNGRTTKKPNHICIAETNHYKSKGVPQHFYIWNPNGNIVDPLDKNPTWKKNPYNIVSYRLVKQIKEEQMREELNDNVVKLLKTIKENIEDFGDRMNSNERKRIEKKIKSIKDLENQVEASDSQALLYKENLDNVQRLLTEKTKDYEKLEKELEENKKTSNNEYKKEIEILNKKLSMSNKKCTDLANQSAEIKQSSTKIKRENEHLIAENKRLQSLKDSSYKALNIVERMQEVLKLLTSFKK